MTYLLLTVAAVLPAVLLVWYFQARDMFPEPPGVLWLTFAYGCLSVIPAVILGVTLEQTFQATHALSAAAFEAFVIAALCEEACKLAVLLGYSFRHSAFDEPMDGIVYGATASLGFAVLHNIDYTSSTADSASPSCAGCCRCQGMRPTAGDWLPTWAVPAPIASDAGGW